MIDTLDEHELRILLEKAREYRDQLGVDSREMRPVIINIQNNEIIDGKHRLEADPEWPIVYIDVDPNSVYLDILRFNLNYGRRQMSPEEKRSILIEIAQKTGWNIPKISEETGTPISTIYRYMPAEFKRSYVFHNEKSVITQQSKNLSHERLEKDNQKSKLTEKENLHLTGESLKIPEFVLIQQTLNEINEKYPGVSPIFFARAVSRKHDLTYEDALPLVTEYCSHRQGNRKLKEDISKRTMFSCPLCRTFRPYQSHKVTLRTLKKEDGELHNIYLDRLKKQGWQE